MRLSKLVTVNAFVFVALGLAFTLYAPNALEYLNIKNLLDILPAEQEGSTMIYWSLVSLARLFGMAMFGLGILLWAVKGITADLTIASEYRRGIAFSMLIACLVGAFTCFTQAAAIWGTPAGWLLGGIFVIFTIGYFIAIMKKEEPATPV